MPKRLIIIGGGTAGFFCAANLKHPNLEVIILEKTQKLLSKVRISGGGRCNLTNASFNSVPDFSDAYPRGKNLLKKTLYRFGWEETMKWFEDRGVPLKIESDGRVFPKSDSSESIIQCLMDACKENDVKILLGTAAQGIEIEKDKLIVKTSTKDYHTDFICIATGGYNHPSQYAWLNNLKIPLVDPVPSLFTFNLPGHPIRELMGVSISPVKLNIVGTKIESEGPLLITHWGLSGPAVLRASAWGARLLAEKNWNFQVRVNWLGNKYQEHSLIEDFENIRRQQRNALVLNKNPFGLPSRLWKFLLQQSGIEAHQRWDNLSGKLSRKLINLLTQYVFEVKGKTTFKEEFVTAGGISLPSIDPKTMQLRGLATNNIYAIGEATDVDGITGGFNFQNAWIGAFIVAEDILRKLSQ